MLMFRSLSILVLALALFIATGCGGSDSSGSTTETSGGDPADAVEADFISRTGYSAENTVSASAAVTSAPDKVSAECGEIECRAEIINGNDGTTKVVARYSLADDGTPTLADYECLTEGPYCDAIEASGADSG